MDAASWIVTILGLLAMGWVVWYFWLYEEAPSPEASSAHSLSENSATPMRTQTETLQIEGMHCGHCVKAVDEALAGTAGVEAREVEIGTARVTFNPEETSRAALAQAIEEAGYTVRNGQ